MAHGDLQLNLLCASGLKNVQLFGMMDPYCSLELAGQQRLKSKTCVDGGTQPVWNQVLCFSSVDPTRASELVLRCWNANKMTSDDEIGAARLPLAAVYGSSCQDVWVQLMDQQGKAAGEVSLILKWRPSTTQQATPSTGPTVQASEGPVPSNLDSPAKHAQLAVPVAVAAGAADVQVPAAVPEGVPVPAAGAAAVPAGVPVPAAGAAAVPAGVPVPAAVAVAGAAAVAGEAVPSAPPQPACSPPPGHPQAGRPDLSSGPAPLQPQLHLYQQPSQPPQQQPPQQQPQAAAVAMLPAGYLPAGYPPAGYPPAAVGPAEAPPLRPVPPPGPFPLPQGYPPPLQGPPCPPAYDPPPQGPMYPGAPEAPARPFSPAGPPAGPFPMPAGPYPPAGPPSGAFPPPLGYPQAPPPAYYHPGLGHPSGAAQVPLPYAYPPPTAYAAAPQPGGYPSGSTMAAGAALGALGGLAMGSIMLGPGHHHHYHPPYYGKWKGRHKWGKGFKGRFKGGFSKRWK